MVVIEPGPCGHGCRKNGAFIPFRYVAIATNQECKMENFVTLS